MSGVVASRDELLPFVGPPYTLGLFALFGRLPFDVAVRIWGAVIALAAALFVLCIARLAGLRDPLSLAALVILAAAFGPLTSALALGQVAVLASFGVAATTLALRGRTHTALAVGAVLLALLQPNVGAKLVTRLSDRKAWLALSIAGAAAAGIGLASVGGVAGIARYAAVLAAHARAESGIAIQLTVAATAGGFGMHPDIARVFGWATSFAVAATTAWVVCRPAFGAVQRVAIACAALPLVVTFAHEHDLMLVLFPGVLCLVRTRGAMRLGTGAATVLVAVDWLGLAQRPSGLPQSVALAGAAALAAIALLDEPRPFALVVPLTFVLAVALAGGIAAHHPLGVWPYALGKTFAAPPELTAPEVWALEAARSGLSAPNVGAAALRTASLAGCASLWLISLVTFYSSWRPSRWVHAEDRRALSFASRLVH